MLATSKQGAKQLVALYKQLQRNMLEAGLRSRRTVWWYSADIIAKMQRCATLSMFSAHSSRSSLPRLRTAVGARLSLEPCGSSGSASVLHSIITVAPPTHSPSTAMSSVIRGAEKDDNKVNHRHSDTNPNNILLVRGEMRLQSHF